MALKATALALHEIPQEHRKFYKAVGDGTFILDVENEGAVALGRVSDLKVEVAKWKGHVERVVIAEKIEAALDAAQVDPVWRYVFVDRMTAAVRLREDGDDLDVDVIDDQGIEIVTGRGERMTITNLAADLRRAHPRCFIDSETKPQTTSNSSSAWTGLNPFATGNVTDQCRLYRADPELYARWKTEASGSCGSNGYAGKNPFLKDTFNLTEQGKLYRENPALYERLKAEAAAE